MVSVFVEFIVTNKRTIAKSALSLKREIISPYSKLFIILSVLLLIFTSLISYHSTINSIKEIDLRHSKRIVNEVLSLLDKPYKSVKENISLYNIGALDNLTENDIRVLFSSQYMLHEDLTLVGYGLEDGTYIDVQYFDEKSLFSSERDPQTGYFKGWQINFKGEVLSLVTSSAYDHRKRPWYKMVDRNSNTLSWTPVYTSIKPKSLFLTLTAPIFDDSNRFSGVVVSSISLTKLSRILKNLENRDDVHIYIIEDNGDLVASTEHEKVYRINDNKLDRINIFQDTTYNWDDLSKHIEVDKFKSKFIWKDRVPYVIDSHPIVDKRGINWEIIILHPADKMLLNIAFKSLVILLFAIVINIVCIKIGYRIAQKLSVPILNIKKASDDIVNGNLKSRAEFFKDDEIGQMSISFNKMADTIYQLINNLEYKVQERTRELELSKKKLSLHIENTPLAVIEWDNDFTITAWNKGAEKIFGYTEEEVVGIHKAEYLLPKEDEYRIGVRKVMNDLLGNSGGNRNININKTKDGSLIHCDWYNTTLIDNSGKVYGVASLALDISNQVKYHEMQNERNKNLEIMSYIDGLTSIANRRSFDYCLEKEWSRALRNKTSLSFLIADIDYFKDYNDFYGHTAGDKCLRKIGETINISLKRSADKAFRYGGEEFACILPETDIDGALTIAKTIQDSINGLEMIHENSTVNSYVTLSIGVSTFVPTKEHSSQDLVNLADKRLYDAKKSGRNKICYS